MDRAEFGELQAEMTAQWLENVKRTHGDVGKYIDIRKIAYLNRWKEAGRFIDDGANILDIGGGQIYDSLVSYLKERDFTYSFLDVDPSTISTARDVTKRVGLKTQSIAQGFNDTLDYPASNFDAVFSSHCIEHSIDLLKTFHELNRIIKVGGNLLMGVPLGWEANPAHPYFLGPNEWVALIEDAGFKIRSTQISYELAETGADFFIAARKTDQVPRFRIHPRDFLKDSFHFVGSSDESISYEGDFSFQEEFAKSIENGAVIRIEPPYGAGQIFPILVRYDWAGIVNIRSGNLTATEDLYSWYPYTMPTRSISVTQSRVEIEVAGRNSVSRWTEIMFAGYMWR